MKTYLFLLSGSPDLAGWNVEYHLKDDDAAYDKGCAMLHFFQHMPDFRAIRIFKDGVYIGECSSIHQHEVRRPLTIIFGDKA